MSHYEWRGVDSFQDNRNDREIEPGDVVEIDDHVAGPNPGFVEVDEPEPEEYTCAEGDCSRTVDGPDTFCWQHDPDDE